MTFNKLLLSLFLSLSMCATLVTARDLEVFQHPARPHQTDYVVFRDINNAKQFFFLPVRIELVPNEDKTPKFGLQHFGYSIVEESGRNATINLTFRYAFSNEKIVQIRNFLESVNPGTEIALTPLSSVSTRSWFISGDQRKKGFPTEAISSGNVSLDAQQAQIIDLKDIAPNQLYDMLSTNTQRAGIVLEVKLTDIIKEGEQITLDTQSLKGRFNELRTWGAGLDILGLVLEVERFAAIDGGKRAFNVRERAAIQSWLIRLLGQPDLTQTNEGGFFVGWDLLRSDILATLDASPEIRLVLPHINLDFTFYSFLVFNKFCDTIPNQIVDISSIKSGCQQFWSPTLGSPIGKLRLDEAISKMKNKTISATAFLEIVERIFMSGEITEQQQAKAKNLVVGK